MEEGDMAKDSEERQLGPQRTSRYLVEQELGCDGLIPGKVYTGLAFTD